MGAGRDLTLKPNSYSNQRRLINRGRCTRSSHAVDHIHDLLAFVSFWWIFAWFVLYPLRSSTYFLPKLMARPLMSSWFTLWEKHQSFGSSQEPNLPRKTTAVQKCSVGFTLWCTNKNRSCFLFVEKCHHWFLYEVRLPGTGEWQIKGKQLLSCAVEVVLLSFHVSQDRRGRSQYDSAPSKGTEGPSHGRSWSDVFDSARHHHHHTITWRGKSFSNITPAHIQGTRSVQAAPVTRGGTTTLLSTLYCFLA